MAVEWFDSLDSDVRFCFCRFTQLGFLRLLTAESVMGEDVLTQREAWDVYDRWLTDDRVSLVEEPHGLEQPLRPLTRSRRASPKTWADAYLIAFADTSQMTLVTFDGRSAAGRNRSSGPRNDEPGLSAARRPVARCVEAALADFRALEMVLHAGLVQQWLVRERPCGRNLRSQCDNSLPPHATM